MREPRRHHTSWFLADLVLCLQAENSLSMKDYLTRLMSLQNEARQNLISAKERSKIYYDRKLHPLDLVPGSFVFLKKEFKTSKFDDTHTGPHQVLGILDNKNVKIKIETKEKIVSIDRLMKSAIGN